MLIFGAFLSLDSIFILHNQWYQFVNEFNADLTTGIRMASLFSNYKFLILLSKLNHIFLSPLLSLQPLWKPQTYQQFKLFRCRGLTCMIVHKSLLGRDEIIQILLTFSKQGNTFKKQQFNALFINQTVKK